ncbi:hypothetical protein [Bacillus paralicheniformis]|uniref:hypothetical protein n=1 Tax=Bacillus paralicheniformis TaxID=1648923 RepID=UPI00189AC4C4|nr:hypothetical protein [Bacillus paralicheniformis]
MFKIHETTNTLKSYLEMDVFNEDTKKRVKGADIVLLPNFGIKEGVDRTFQPDTVAFYKYSIATIGNEAKIELFENKGEEKILALHSFDIWIPLMSIGSSILLPFTINLVSSYVYEKMKGRPNDEPTVHFNLMVENKEKGKSKHLSYKGSVDGFKESFKKLDVNKLWEDE